LTASPSTDSKRHTVAVFMGTRPEAIKLAPVIRCLEEHPYLEPFVVSTGQHREMLAQAVELFRLPVHRMLEVMRPNQSLAELTSRLLTACDEVLREVHPDLVLVQGDTTTALSAALCAFYQNIPLGHIESGLRTGNPRAPFPEETNRVLTARLATLHFAPTIEAARNLLAEGVDATSVYVTGNTVIDALRTELTRQSLPGARAAVRTALAEEGVILPPRDNRPLVLITCHRRENFGDGLESICRAVAQLARSFRDHQFVYLLHLNPNVKGPVLESLKHIENVRLLSPQPYSQFVALLQHSKLVFTDSGGVQEEAPSMGKPVLVLRETTERPEGVAAGTVRLVGSDYERIISAATELLTSPSAHAQMAKSVDPYGDGLASGRIVDIVAKYFAQPEH
jgi:UDP-N-acetylglucosamine 2-epimerase (non-hydrolysing)